MSSGPLVVIGDVICAATCHLRRGDRTLSPEDSAPAHRERGAHNRADAGRGVGRLTRLAAPGGDDGERCQVQAAVCDVGEVPVDLTAGEQSSGQYLVTRRSREVRRMRPNPASNSAPMCLRSG